MKTSYSYFNASKDDITFCINQNNNVVEEKSKLNLPEEKIFRLNSLIFNDKKEKQEIYTKYDCIYSEKENSIYLIFNQNVNYSEFTKDKLINILDFVNSIGIDYIYILINQNNKSFVNIMQDMILVGFEFGKEYLEGCTISANDLLQQAADAAKKIMDEGPYKLHTGTPYTAGGRGAYRDLFTSDNPVSEEVMLAVALSKELSNLGEANWYYNSTSYGPHTSMTRAFAKTYLNADGTIYNEKTASGSYKTFAQETTGRDPRMCQTIRGADYTRLDASKVYVKTAPDMSLSLTGYQYTKHVMDDIGYDGARSNDNDTPILRYAEVLLNYAEAKAELGTITVDDWTKTIGALRRRAGITGGDLDKLPTVVDTYLQQTFYPNVTDPIILEIRRDRAIELILEGFRLNDLKRWACGSNWQNAPWDGIYIPALDTPLDLNGDGTYDVYVTADANYQKNGTYKAITMTLNDHQVVEALADDPAKGYKLGYVMPRKWNDNMYIYPVPESVILINDNLKQNPGWITK